MRLLHLLVYLCVWVCVCAVSSRTPAIRACIITRFLNVRILLYRPRGIFIPTVSYIMLKISRVKLEIVEFSNNFF